MRALSYGGNDRIVSIFVGSKGVGRSFLRISTGAPNDKGKVEPSKKEAAEFARGTPRPIGVRHSEGNCRGKTAEGKQLRKIR